MLSCCRYSTAAGSGTDGGSGGWLVVGGQRAIISSTRNAVGEYTGMESLMLQMDVTTFPIKG